MHENASTRVRMPVRALLAVAVGGVVGTAARLAIDVALPNAPDGIPWSTLIVNVVGSFVLGILVARVWPVAPEWLRAGLGAGVLGSFTTFSAVAVAMIELPMAEAAVYLAVSVVLGLGAALLGLGLGRRADAASTSIDPVNE